MPVPFDILTALGYTTQDWARWQQGKCGTYALALADRHGLRVGAIVNRYWDEDDQEMYDEETHFFAHDDHYAYDSAGIHALPYLGLYPHCDDSQVPQPSPDPENLNMPGLLCVLDVNPDEYGLRDEARPDDLAAALDHAERHQLTPGNRPTRA